MPPRDNPVEGTTACIEGNSVTCADNGTRLAPQQTCGLDNGTYCDPTKGTCAPFTCEPAQPLCNGELATSCNSDGSGPRDTGIDCSATGKACWDGECLPILCDTPYQCSTQGELLRCDKHGTALVVEKTCTPAGGTVCDAAAGTCRLQKCPPSQPACNGNLATTCDATGLDFDPLASAVDCSPSHAACVDGACLPIICAPDQTYCSAAPGAASELRRCNATGTASTLLATCGDTEFCRNGESNCLPRVCSPGSAVCSGNVLTECAADGSGPKPGGTDCAATPLTTCDLGECRPTVCNANQRLCQSGDVYVSNSAGTDAAVYDNCDPREYCDSPTSRPQDTACKPDLCISNRAACAGETLATCKPDGSGTQNPTTDCGAQNQVCDLGGACLSQAIDTLSANATASFTSPTIHFALLRVITSRQLKQLEASLSIPGTGSHSITWFVYRSSAPQGPHALILLANATASESATSLAWAPANLVLEANSYYLLGVSASEPHQVAVASNATPLPVSFAQILGGYTLPLTGSAPGEIRIGAGEVGEAMGVAVTTAR